MFAIPSFYGKKEKRFKVIMMENEENRLETSFHDLFPVWFANVALFKICKEKGDNALRQNQKFKLSQ